MGMGTDDCSCVFLVVLLPVPCVPREEEGWWKKEGSLFFLQGVLPCGEAGIIC